jgi:hypothetical protein
MLKSTIEAVKAVLRTDETLTVRDREGFIKLLSHPVERLKPEPFAPTEPRLVRRAEAARRLACSVRLIDRLARDGILQKRRLPNRQRAAGFLESDVSALIGVRPETPALPTKARELYEAVK